MSKLIWAVRPLIALLALVGQVPAGHGEDLIILTSFPPAFYEPITEKFQQSHPDITVEIVQRSTTSAVRFLLERDRVDVDVFWASSPDAFELLKSQNQLAVLQVSTPLEDRTVAGYPVNDVDNTYFGFAFSTFGAAYNPDYLARHDLPVPRRWSDLTLPAYWGHVGVTSPSRSGTTHFIVEAILQTYGWDQGWALIARMGGNLSTITARSFGIADGIEQARFGLGPSIDFLATVERSSDAIAFAVLDPLFLVPASVAVLERSASPTAGAAFVDFLLSTDVQLMLMSPQLGRIPVIDELRTLALAKRGTRLPAPLLDNGATFDAALSAHRYGLVNALFDAWIVDHRSEISAIWARVNTMDATSARSLISLLTQPPIDELRALELMAIPNDAGYGGPIEEMPEVSEEISQAVSGRLSMIASELERVASNPATQ
ncbi:MAG: extracellular solute-binding protein [Devosia sp.]|uniref:ABC transporter substrate-binding protein n=1 Tax=Devosia sp. TaxID=1871048 RepID=UPI0024C85B04|nr:extracellular solute-binding protein [Devosia sp.]UYO00531.1 MAG: extracellular solute-binding protein [Devosia sp.]